MSLGFPPLGVGKISGSSGGSGNLSPPDVTDYFNGFALPGSTYSGGPTVVADNDGTLVTSPADVLPIDGMRLTDGVWYPTDSNGDPIHTTTPLRTTKGTVQKYAETYKGPLIEPARTNLLTYSQQFDNDVWGKTATTITANQYMAPDNTLTGDKMTHTGIGYITQEVSASAGAVATFSMYARYVDNPWIKIFITDASRANGVLAFFNLQTGTIGNTTTLGTGTDLSASMKQVGAGWYRISVTGAVPTVSTYLAWWYLTTGDNSSTRNKGTYAGIWQAQLEVGSFPTSYIPTGATTITRPAANLTRLTAGTALESGNNFAIYGRVVPKAGGQSKTLFSSYLDTTHYFEVYTLSGITVSIRKAIGGSNIYKDKSYTQVAGIPFEYLAYNHSVYGMGVAVKQDGGSWLVFSENTYGQSVTLPASYQVGAGSNASHFAGNYPFTEIIRLNPNLHPQTQLADLLAKGRI